MRKNKLVVIIMHIVLSCSVVYAEAPELRNVMPNSWQKVERVTGEEEQRVIAENDSDIREIIGKIKSKVFNGQDFLMILTDENNLHIKTYKQQAGSDTFYRFFITDKEADTYDEDGQQHIQIVIWQKEERHITLGAGMYNYRIGTQYDNKISHISIDIIESGGSAKAVLISHVVVSEGKGNDKYENKENGQPAGNVGCEYYKLENYGEDTQYNYYGGGRILPNNVPSITIEGSPCL